jgi:hemerythrin-like domain-containing protein
MTEDTLQHLFRHHDQQHRQISEWASLVRVATLLQPGALARPRVARLRHFYRDTMLAHFAFEERTLFPALLAVCGTAYLEHRLRSFVEEHDELRLRIEVLLADLDSLGGPVEAREAEDAVVRRGRLTIDRLLEHAAEEDELLLPLLERHRGELREALGVSTAGIIGMAGANPVGERS